MKSQQNNICVCGHYKEDHRGWENEPTGCQGDDGSVVGGICECSEFKLDNLRFLEICYEEKATEA